MFCITEFDRLRGQSLEYARLSPEKDHPRYGIHFLRIRPVIRGGGVSLVTAAKAAALWPLK
jgi:hypothetical protein